MDHFSQKPKDSKHRSVMALAQKGHLFEAFSAHVDRDTLFYIGSISKHMTAYMLLISLHEKYPKADLGSLLQKPLSSLFPNSTTLNPLNKEWVHQVNSIDLLTHRSGLSDYVYTYEDHYQDLNQPIDAITLLQAAEFDKEQKYAYSNSNYLLLGKLIEEINQASFDQVFERLIKMPAQMENSFAPTSGNYYSLKNQYALAPNLNTEIFFNMQNALGTGNVISTERDLMKWSSYLFKKAPKVIKDLMLKNYGTSPEEDILNLGLTSENTPYSGMLIGHQGRLDSFNSFFGYLPETDSTVVLLTNSDDKIIPMLDVLGTWLSKPSSIDLQSYDIFSITEIDELSSSYTYNTSLVSINPW